MEPLSIVILGLSITSAWGNGHATTYRGLVRALSERGHSLLFLERDVPWYAENRDLPHPPYAQTELYSSLADLQQRFAAQVAAADLVIVGSYVPEGVAVGQWVLRQAQVMTAFYDIDTPVTLAKLANHDYEYLTPELIAAYHCYLSFTGGPTLQLLEREYGSPMARPLYCSVDPDLYAPEDVAHTWLLGYLGTYSADRQPSVERFLFAPAQALPAEHFVVAGPQYPDLDAWPSNVQHCAHIPPDRHRRFYNQQTFTLNVTRADMIRAGFAPSVRLFEAAACGVPIISDVWPGIETFFVPNEEILLARSTADVLRYLQLDSAARQAIAQRARARVLAEHTAAQRACELEGYVREWRSQSTLTAEVS